MGLLAEALTYLDMGWCVYPAHSINYLTGFCSCGNQKCPCPGKHPIGQWADYRNRLPTKIEVDLWFSTLDCNIGTITGQISGIAVVDVDGQKGIESIKKLNLEPTLTARTGGGGFHYFYFTTVTAATRIGVLPGVDIRGDGGYVILSPSSHMSGSHYKWKDVRRLAPYDAELFERQIRSPSSIPGWANEALQGVGEGVRSITAAKLSARYFALGLSLEEVWVLLSGWNERNSPPLNEVELKRTVMGMQRKHMSPTTAVEITTFDEIRNLLDVSIRRSK